jgi:hypothetical protein
MFSLFEPDPEAIPETNEKNDIVYGPETAEGRS